MDRAEYLRRVRSYIKVPTKELEDQLTEFCNICTYISGQYDKDESFIALNEHLEKLEAGNQQQHRVFYMALPPSVFISVSEQLKRNCYPKKGITRIIVRGFLHDVYLVPRKTDCRLWRHRLRNHSARTSRALVNCSRPSNPTGRKMRFSVSITIWAKRW